MERTRRAFLGFCLATGATALEACSSSPTAQGTPSLREPTRLPAPYAPTESPQDRLRALREKNKNENKYLSDKSLLTDAEFNRINNGLGQSPSLLLQLISRSLQEVWASENNPSAFPRWISESSTPIAITRDQGPASFFTAVPNFNGPDRFKMISPQGKESLYQKTEPLTLGINLGLKKFTEGTPIQTALMEGMLVTKEWINIVGMISSVNNFILTFEPQGYKFLSVDTNQRVNGNDAIDAALAVYYFELIDKNSELYTAVDGFPAALIATQINALVSNGALPKNSNILSTFYTVVNMLNRPQTSGVKVKLTNFVDRWAKSGNIIPPDDFLPLMVEPEVLVFIREFQTELIKLTKP